MCTALSEDPEFDAHYPLKGCLQSPVTLASLDSSSLFGLNMQLQSYVHTPTQTYIIKNKNKSPKHRRYKERET